MLFRSIEGVLGVLVAIWAHQYSNTPGFFLGIIHGFTVAFAFIGSMFTSIHIYASPNSGGWYDFGYVIGINCWAGIGGLMELRRDRSTQRQ